MNISPPRFKCKIPGYLSYPISAGDIAKEIQPETNDYPFSFSFFSYKHPKQNQESIPSYSVLSLRFRLPYPSEPEPRWELTVHPVFRIHRKQISDLLFTKGFFAIRDWLNLSRPPSWYISSHNISVDYITSQKIISYHISA